MLYGCTAGTINGVCTACASGFTLNATDKTCEFTSVMSVGYDWSTKTFKSTTHVPYSTEQIFPPFDENSPSVDWRTVGIITPVRDEGACDSSYASTAADLAASAWSIKTGISGVIPSIQMILDCETVTSTGCSGGSVQAALTSYATLGAYSEAQWPYTAAADGTCHVFEKGDTPFNHMSKFALE
jgi:hypothetical protein